MKKPETTYKTVTPTKTIQISSKTTSARTNNKTTTTATSWELRQQRQARVWKIILDGNKNRNQPECQKLKFYKSDQHNAKTKTSRQRRDWLTNALTLRNRSCGARKWWTSSLDHKMRFKCQSKLNAVPSGHEFGLCAEIFAYMPKSKNQNKKPQEIPSKSMETNTLKDFLRHHNRKIWTAVRKNLTCNMKTIK